MYTNEKPSPVITTKEGGIITIIVALRDKLENPL